jgi:hypothetical protein
MQFRGTPLHVHIDGGELTVAAPAEGFSGALQVCVGDEVRELGAGERASFALAQPTAAAR